MRTFFFRLPALVLALVLIALAVSNRSHILITLPLTELALSLPVYAIFFAGMIFGIILTGLVLAPPRLRGYAARRRAEKRASQAEGRLARQPRGMAEKRAMAIEAIDKAQEPGQASPPKVK